MRHSRSAPRRIFEVCPAMEIIAIVTRDPLTWLPFTSPIRPGMGCGNNGPTIFIVRLTTIRSDSRHGLMPNAHIVCPPKVAVIILLSGQSAWVHKRPIDPLLARGPPTLRPGIEPVARSPFHFWIRDPAMASTPQDTGLTGESNSIVKLTNV